MKQVKYTQADLQLLEHLMTFKYLTMAQMIKLKVAKHKSSIHRIVKRLVSGDKPLLNKLSFAIDPIKGRLADVYYLSRDGAKFLSEYLLIPINEIEYPREANAYFKDYFHRILTIDYHIKVFNYAKEYNLEIVFFHRYFDKIGSNRTKNPNNKLRAKTRVDLENGDFFIPDINYMLIDEDGNKQLFTVEIHRGKDIKRALNQIEQHLIALEEGAVTEKYNLIDEKVPYSVVFMFEFEEIKERVRKRFYEIEELESFREYFEFINLNNFHTKEIK